MTCFSHRNGPQQPKTEPFWCPVRPLFPQKLCRYDLRALQQAQKVRRLEGDRRMAINSQKMKQQMSEERNGSYHCVVFGSAKKLKSTRPLIRVGQTLAVKFAQKSHFCFFFEKMILPIFLVYFTILFARLGPGLLQAFFLLVTRNGLQFQFC